LAAFVSSRTKAAKSAGSPYLDFGARLYDPRTAVWLCQDPMAEKYYSISPYAYCAGNPVNLVDLDGKEGV
jgi:RHS repeat-associated protein